MDTGTHIVMGVALGGLATLDPAVQQDPLLFQAIFAGTVIGSHAPDFDTVLKLRDNATYIRHHRGISHSIPAVIFLGSSRIFYYPFTCPRSFLSPSMALDIFSGDDTCFRRFI